MSCPIGQVYTLTGATDALVDREAVYDMYRLLGYDPDSSQPPRDVVYEVAAMVADRAALDAASQAITRVEDITLDSSRAGNLWAKRAVQLREKAQQIRDEAEPMFIAVPFTGRPGRPEATEW
ncbi:hypothetical protein ACUH93_00580 [Dermabacteraceae bacterium P7006]